MNTFVGFGGTTLSKLVRLYWDSCAWLGLLNGEQDKKRELEIVYGNARQGFCEIWTSTFSHVEVNRTVGEHGKRKPFDPETARTIDALFGQEFVKPISLDIEVATLARMLWRETEGLRKFKDSIHLASALRWNIEVLHTYDNEDLLHLNGKLKCKNGKTLAICYPDETTDGPLFSRVRATQ